jgi:hypothetical protein
VTAAGALEVLDGLGLELRAAEAWPYATSHRLTSLVVVDASGGDRRLLHKRLDEGGLLPEAVDRRPAAVVDPRREIDAYRHVLPHLEGPAACVASSVEEQWLLLEHVDGPVLWQVGELDRWREAARWLGRAHHRLAPLAAEAPDSFVRYDAAHCHAWAARARRHEHDPGRRRRLDHLLDVHARAVEELAALPVTVVHGECYPSNVVLADAGPVPRVCVLDWEMAGVGPGALDLAALAGGWAPSERQELVGAYAAATGRIPGSVGREADVAELHLCIRWLGWSAGWQPPEEHAADWLARGLELAEELGL